MLVASSRLELRWKMMGASALFLPVLSTRLELWESPLGFVQMVDLSLLSSRPRGEELLLEEGEASCQGVRVAVEGEVVLMNVHSCVWVRVSHLIFNGGNSSMHGQGEDGARHGASLGQTPSHGVGDDITVPSSLHVSSCPALKRTAHHFHTFLSRASVSLWMASPIRPTPWAFFTSTLAMAASSVDGDVGRDNFVEQLWALFHPNSKLVRAGNAAHFLGEKFGSGLCRPAA